MEIISKTSHKVYIMKISIFWQGYRYRLRKYISLFSLDSMDKSYN